jgi:YVTN family beta-propeller protein
MARLVGLILVLLSLAGGQTPEQPARIVQDPGVVTTRQNITPAGVQAAFQGRVYGVDFGASTQEVWVLNAGQIVRLDWKSNRVLARIPLGGNPGLQGIRFDPVDGVPLVGATRSTRVRLLAVRNAQAEVIADDLGRQICGAPAVAPKPDPRGRRIAVAPLVYDNRLAVIDLGARTLLAKIPTGIAPFGAAINSTGTVAYVSNWGGRPPKPGDLTAPTGLLANADQVVIDGRGIASTGTVTRIDLRTQSTTTIAVGLHPTAILWDEPRRRLYVANSNADSVTVIDTREDRVIHTLPIQPFQARAPGIAPTALAVSPDGTRLWVACGGINAIAVVNTAERKIEGLVPTAWYPNGLAASRDGRYLAVSTLLGPGSGWREEPRKRFALNHRGSVSVIEVPSPAQLAGYTTVVAENNRLSLGPPQPAPAPAQGAAPVPIPEKAGEPSLIEHVVFIIKENRTYDQVLGDIRKGNGDPSLVMFGPDVTPNQHALAEGFVLLDNFYASGGNSADGHQWLTQANETAYCLWPGYTGRSYPFDGTDPIAYSAGGFLWDAALKMKKTVRIWGEYAGRLGIPPKERLSLLERWRTGEDFSKAWSIRAPIEPLNKLLVTNYPSYSAAVPDVIRAQLFLADVKRMEAEGKMPNLLLVQLPSNHTYGANPGVSSAKAMVADNDLALGRIVEGLTRTQFWRKMAIFVVEDDAQNGVDHVDGHRTVALAISPYVRRGAVDSTFYSQQSILKTIELIFGLPALSLFDLIANDMRASFANTPDFAGYTAVEPRQSLFETNPALNAVRGAERRAALDSMKMRWDIPDAAPTEKLNRILWHQVRGWDTPYPGPRRAVFAPLSLDVDDDDRE